MLKVKNIELAFDITSPTDVQRYMTAGQRMEALGANISMTVIDPSDPGFMDSYIEMLNTQLRLFGNFLDEVFGDGVALQLLGENPSLNKVTEVSDALAVAMEKQGSEFGIKLQKYKPNRTQRAKR